jgi:hypothetical protein
MRVEWLHVDGCLSEIKLELVIDNPILLRWDIKYVFRCCLRTNKLIRSKFFRWDIDCVFFFSFAVEMEMEIDILLKYLQSRFFIRKLRFSVVLFCG